MSEKKVGKRLLTWVLVLVMTLSLLPLNVLAANPAVMRIVRPDTDKYITYNFYLNEGDKTPYYSQIIKNNESLDVPATPEKEGYKFDGWYNGDEQFTTFGTPISVTADSTDVNLYAKFVPVCYVYFMDGTGSDARIIATEMLTPEGSLSSEDFDRAALLVPVGAEQAVIGWTKDDEQVGEVSYVEGGSIYLYPIIANGHWITFDSKGGSYVDPQFVTDTTEEPTAPTKSGYDFAGWYDGDTKFSFGGTLDSNKDLTAHWTAKNAVNYTVIHWLENADDTEYSYKESVQMSGAAGSQTTATAKSYEGFTAQTITQETIAGDGSTIVNVYYKRDVYEVKFYSVKWVPTGLFRGYYDADKLLKTITAKHGAFIGDQWPTINGSSTWQTNPSGQPYQVNIETMPLGGATFYGPKTGSGSETAYYYVEVLPGESGGTLVGGKYYKQHHEDTSPGTGYSVTKEDQYDITGYTFNATISTKIGKKYDNAKFYYTRNNYDVVFVNNGKTVHTQSYPFKASIAEAGSYTPSRPEGIDAAYVFTGWYADPAGAQLYDFDGKTMPAQNITVYAHWAAPVHKVTFMVGETTYKTMVNVEHKATITLPPNPTSTDSTEDFLGWTYQDGKPFNPETKITGDLTLYAKFGSKTGYSVTYVTEGSSPVTDDKLYAEDAYATVLNGPSTAPAGKVFLYWNASSDSSGKKYYPNDKVLVPKGGVTLTAVYGPVAQVLTLTYHSNYPDGTDTTNTTAVESNLKNNALIPVAAKDKFTAPTGYEFDCWNTKADGTGDKFAAGSSARVDNIGSNDLYAQWKPIQITDEITVTIKGNTKTVRYNGKEQSVTGFTYTAPEGVKVTPKDGFKPEAKGTDKGTYYMYLTKGDFIVSSKIYKEFEIIVKDGYLEITRSGGHHPRPKPTVEIEDDDALGLNTTDHFAYIVGYGNGEVRPQNNITRAEVATIFFRLLTDDVRDENLTKTNRYSDVTRADWYNTAVSTLSSMGIITGYPDGTFRPNAAITRAEFAAIAARFDSNGDKTTAKFSDIATHWAKDEISIAYNNGWITGYPDGTFGPQRDITRAETMTLVNRVLNRQPETEDDLLPNMTVWTDNANPNAWYYLAVQEATNSHYYKFKTNSQYEKWTELRETRDWTQLEK